MKNLSIFEPQIEKHDAYKKKNMYMCTKSNKRMWHMKRWNSKNTRNLNLKDFIKELPNYEDEFTFWEEFYVLIRITSQEYSQEKNRKFKNDMDQVTTEIEEIEKIDPKDLPDENLARLNELKVKEQKLIKYRTDGLRELIKFPIVEEKEADITYLKKLLNARVNENYISEQTKKAS